MKNVEIPSLTVWEKGSQRSLGAIKEIISCPDWPRIIFSTEPIHPYIFQHNFTVRHPERGYDYIYVVAGRAVQVQPGGVRGEAPIMMFTALLVYTYLSTPTHLNTCTFVCIIVYWGYKKRAFSTTGNTNKNNELHLSYNSIYYGVPFLSCDFTCFWAFWALQCRIVHP